MNGRLENEINIGNKIEIKIENMSKYINEWFLYLKASERTSATIRDFINKVIRFHKIINKFEVSQITYEDVANYMISIKTKNNNGLIEYTSDSYRQSVWSALNNYFSFLVGRHYIQENYLSMIEKPKNKDLDKINRKRLLLTKEDFNSIINAVKNGTGSKRAKTMQKHMFERDMSIILLFMTTGMRKTALSEINISDIDFINHILVITDKGDKQHEYYLNDDVINYIEMWLEKRQNIAKDNNALFINYEGTRISGNAIYKLVDKYATEGLGYHISPHKLRAGFCSIMFEETGDIEFVRRAVGHSNVTTTQRYIVTNNSERKQASNIMSSIMA